MAATSTVFSVLNQDNEYTIPGDWTPAQIVANYSSQVPGIGNMDYSDTTETRDGGTVRVITFRPRTGNKG